MDKFAHALLEDKQHSLAIESLKKEAGIVNSGLTATQLRILDTLEKNAADAASAGQFLMNLGKGVGRFASDNPAITGAAIGGTRGAFKARRRGESAIKGGLKGAAGGAVIGRGIKAMGSEFNKLKNMRVGDIPSAVASGAGKTKTFFKNLGQYAPSPQQP